MSDTTTIAPELGNRTESPPAPPPPPKRTRNWKKWRARLIVLVMLAGAVLGGARLTQARGDTIAQFDLGTVTLTGQPIPVASDQTGQVTAVDVRAQQPVEAGQKVGSIVVTKLTATGKERRERVALTAPVSGIVVSDPEPVGSILPLGQPFVTMYDPAQLKLSTTVRVEDLSQLAVGMVATLHTDGLDRPFEAVVQRAVPRLESATADPGRLPSGSDRLELVLVARRAGDLAALVPGRRFTGSVDTQTGAGATHSVLQVTS
jgi:multidrug resistance efflux pump